MVYKFKVKMKVIYSVLICNLVVFVTNMKIVHATGFDDGAAKSLAQSYTNPFLTFLLWGIPVSCAVACVVVVITYLIKNDPDEKEQAKPGKVMKRIVFWSVVGESISALLAIVGL